MIKFLRDLLSESFSENNAYDGSLLDRFQAYVNFILPGLLHYEVLHKVQQMFADDIRVEPQNGIYLTLCSLRLIDISLF